MFSSTTRIVRPASLPTSSYVAGEVIDLSAYSGQITQLMLLISITKASATSFQFLLEYSVDNVTYFPLTTESIANGLITLTPAEYTVLASALATNATITIERPIKYRYIRVSTKGSGTLTSSSVAIQANLG